MKYIVITSTGKVMTFFIEEVAKTFAAAYNGTLVTEEVVEMEIA